MVLRRFAVCACSYLFNNQLSGSIPSSLGSLTALQYLCVLRNCCSHCKILRQRARACARSNLGYNQLIGSIPSSLGSLTALQYLCVHRS